MEHPSGCGLLSGRRSAAVVSRPAFHLLDASTSDPEWVFTVRVPATCPYFRGHFPAGPVLPAIGQLALVLQLLERSESEASWIQRAGPLRFLRPVLPGDELTVRIKPALLGGATTFRILRAADLVSEGKLHRHAVEES